MRDRLHLPEAPLSPARQAWWMLVVIAPQAACYPAIKAGLVFAPSLRFAALRTLVGGLALLLVLLIRRKPLWPKALLDAMMKLHAKVGRERSAKALRGASY